MDMMRRESISLRYLVNMSDLPGGITRKSSAASNTTTLSNVSSTSSSILDDDKTTSGYTSDITEPSDDEDDEYQYPSTPIQCLRIPCDSKPPHLVSIPATTKASAASLGRKKYHELDLTGRLPRNKIHITPQSFFNRTHPDLNGTYYVHWLDSKMSERFPENKAATRRGFWGKDEGGECYGDVYIVKVKEETLSGAKEGKVMFEDVSERYLINGRMCRSGSISY